MDTSVTGRYVSLSDFSVEQLRIENAKQALRSFGNEGAQLVLTYLPDMQDMLRAPCVVPVELPNMQIHTRTMQDFG